MFIFCLLHRVIGLVFFFFRFPFVVHCIFEFLCASGLMNLFSSLAQYLFTVFSCRLCRKLKKKSFFFLSHALTVFDLCGMPVNASLIINCLFLSCQHNTFDSRINFFFFLLLLHHLLCYCLPLYILSPFLIWCCSPLLVTCSSIVVHLFVWCSVLVRIFVVRIHFLHWMFFTSLHIMCFMHFFHPWFYSVCCITFYLCPSCHRIWYGCNVLHIPTSNKVSLHWSIRNKFICHLKFDFI